jgi:signal transduction histidine kinase
MSPKSKTVDPSPQQAELWRGRFEKQKIQLRSILSLLDKYGSCLDLHSLYREFVLTLMGQYLVSDACYFSAADASNSLEPAVAYGRTPIDKLQHVEVNSPLVSDLNAEKSVRTLGSLSTDTLEDPALKSLRDTIQVVGPVYLGDTLTGIVFLGKKISKKPYDEHDLDLLQTLCAASAVTFNNARLSENVRLSMEEVQRLSNLRYEMISRISHEFRTPITAIRAALACLPESGMPEPMANALVHSVDRLQQLIDSLLALNSMSTSDLPSDWAIFNPMTPISDLVSANSQEASSKGLTFDIKESTDIGLVSLRIPEEHFALVVETLLKNAIKFSDKTSTIGIELEIVMREPEETADGSLIVDWRAQTRKTLDEYKNLIEGSSSGASDSDPSEEIQTTISDGGTYLVVRITDAGIGIPQKELQFIGEPFRQASNSPDQNVKGKALGLAVVHKILTDCRGQLCCKSQQGIATTFSVFLPLA